MTKETQKNIRFAVVGLGHIGKRHAKMITGNLQAELVAVCDIRPLAELDYLGSVPYYSSIDELLSSEDIDVVCICTPNNLHIPQSLKVLKAGRHVLCEKPLGLTKLSCELLLHEALNASRHVFCVMQNRYSPPAMWLKEVVEKHLLGDIYMVQVNCFWNRDDRYYLKDGKKHAWHGSAEQDGGTLFTQFSHFVDLLYWAFGDIENISSRFFDFNHQHSTDFEDSGIVQFDLKSGGSGTLNYSTSIWGHNFESSITVVGSKGTLKIGGQYMNKVEYCHIDNYELPELSPSNPANEYNGYKGSAANHVYVIENVIDVLSNGKKMTTNALEGLKVVDIIERIYEAKQ